MGRPVLYCCSALDAGNQAQLSALLLACYGRHPLAQFISRHQCGEIAGIGLSAGVHIYIVPTPATIGRNMFSSCKVRIAGPVER
jgi:hypothetical protein